MLLDKFIDAHTIDDCSNLTFDDRNDTLKIAKTVICSNRRIVKIRRCCQYIPNDTTNYFVVKPDTRALWCDHPKPNAGDLWCDVNIFRQFYQGDIVSEITSSHPVLAAVHYNQHREFLPVNNLVLPKICCPYSTITLRVFFGTAPPPLPKFWIKYSVLYLDNKLCKQIKHEKQLETSTHTYSSGYPRKNDKKLFFW